MDDKTWQKGAGSQVVLDSIFAALAAVWITFATQDSLQTRLKFIEIVCSLFSFFLFAISAEGTTNSYDEQDVLKYVYYLLWYNVGVILIGSSIGLLIYAHFSTHLLRFAGPFLSYLPPLIGQILVPTIYSFIFFVLLWRWIADAFWLLFEPQEDFNLYLQELNDEVSPIPERHFFMRLIFRRRLKHEITSA
jgi:hypothetical protein